MQITKTLTAQLSLTAFGPGYTYEFYVETTNCPSEFTEGQILCSGPINSANQYLECEITYENTECTNLVIGLKVLQDGDECTKIHYDIVNDETSTIKHYRCILTNEGDTSSCEEFPGSAEGAGEYDTIEECIACTSCPCKATPSPCDIIQFSVSYSCHPEGPQYPGTLNICLVSGATPGNPVIMQGFQITHPNGTVVYTDPDQEIFITNGQCLEVANVILPSGQYIAVAEFNTPDCSGIDSEFTVNCPITPNPPGNNIIQCCATTSDAGGSAVGNVGNVNCYTLFYPADMDTNEDIVIDFGANGVADKLVVYQGLVYCEDVNASTPIASTPYIGTLSAGEPGKCHNISPNFVPAIGNASDPENTVVQGCWTGNNQLGLYDPSSNAGTVVGSSIALTNPAWADDLWDLAPTHDQVSVNPPIYVPSPGDGGMEHGRGRLRIKGGTYANAENALTLVVHNNGSTYISVPPNAYCGVNTTAWKFFIHCPACPECEGGFTLTPSCESTVKGKITMPITGDFQAPVNIFITPASVAWIYSLLDQGTPFLYRTSNNTYYELIHPESTDYLVTTINDDVSTGDTLTFCYVYNGTTYVLGDVNNGSWTIRMTDAMDCDILHVGSITCNCNTSFVLSGNSSVCEDVNFQMTLTINGGMCNVFANTTITGLESWMQVTNGTVAANQLVIKKKPGETQVPGTYTLHFVYNCGNGCFLEDDITITIKEFNCNVNSVVTDTTCGNDNGSIALRLCPGATVLWNTGSTNTTISGLSPGTYTATITSSNGCSEIFTYEIASDSPVTFSVVDETLDCGVGTATSIVVNDIDGGTAPYTLILSDTSLATVFGPEVIAGPGPVDFTILDGDVTGGLVPGVYKVAITDNNGCETAYNVTIDVEVTPELEVSSSSTTCGYNNGLLTFFVNTGIYPGTYKYYWAEDTAGLDCNNLNLGTLSLVNTVTGVTAGDYTVCAENVITGCCVCEDITVVASTTAPLPPTLPSKVICQGQTTVLTGSCPGGGSLQFFEDADGTIPLASTVVSPTVTTTYYGRCVGGTCVSTLVPVIVTVNASPTANAGTDRHKCSSGTCNGGSVTLSGSCPGCVGCTAAWYNGNNLVVGSGTTASVNPSTTTNYTFKCTSPNGCVSSDIATVWVSAPPVVTVNNVTTCAGTAVSFNSVITSPLPVNNSIIWYSAAGCSGSVLPSPTSLVHNAAGTYNYSVKVTDTETGCCTCSNFTLTVTANPTTTPTYTYNCATNSITLAVNAGTCSGNPCSVSWTKQGSPTVIGTSATLIYNTAPLNGTYIATVNCCGCISTGSVTVTTTPPPTITLPADVSFCKGVGTYSVPVSLSGLTNFTWTSTWSGSAATYPITATCNSGCTSPIQVSKANSGVLTITVSGTSANGCVVTDSMTITITDGPLLTLQDACKTTDNTWQDVITDYNPLYTYYWGPSTMPNLTTCGSGVGFQITNPSQSLTATGASGLITIRAEYQGCCKFANANIFLQPHLTLFGVECTPSQNDNLAAVHLYLVPGNYFGVPYNITVTGTNLSDNTVVSTVVPINNAIQQTVSFPSVTSGSWEFMAYIGTNANMPAAACPFILEVPVECCSACSAGTWTTATRTLYVGTISPGGAQPYNATIKFPTVFSAGNVLQNKILNTDQITVRIYDDSLALVSTIGPHPVKDGGGLSITGNFVIDGITTNGDYFIETEAATSGGTVYSRTVQNLTVSGGGHTLASDTNTVFLNQAGIDSNYTLTLTMCNKGEIVPRVDGTYTITNVPTGQETVFSTCADGFENILLPAVVVPTSVIRLQYECLDSCSGCWGGCVSCALGILRLRRSSISPLFVDNFIYCYNS